MPHTAPPRTMAICHGSAMGWPWNEVCTPAGAGHTRVMLGVKDQDWGQPEDMYLQGGREGGGGGGGGSLRRLQQRGCGSSRAWLANETQRHGMPHTRSHVIQLTAKEM